eukprot:1145320-Pelagomonas_calceolata.AAC.10
MSLSHGPHFERRRHSGAPLRASTFLQLQLTLLLLTVFQAESMQGVPVHMSDLCFFQNMLDRCQG